MMKSLFKILSKIFLIFLFSLVWGSSQVKTDNEFSYYANPRFNFRIYLPKGFQEKYSDNGDGITLISLHNDKVKIAAWGGYNVMSHDLGEEVQFITKGYKVLEKKKITVNNDLNKKLYGYLLVLQRDKSRVLHFVSQKSDVNYGIHCSAPHPQFKDYEFIFDKIIKSFKILKD